MIITITGMPCSGKSSVAEYLSKKYGFEIIRVSQKFREEAEKKGMNVLEFNDYLLRSDLAGKFDIELDEWTKALGKKRKDDKLIFDSRLAWHFVPNSFKVFIDCSISVMKSRLKSSNRKLSEKEIKDDKGVDSLMQRVHLENERYMKIYNVNYLDRSNYDFVINSKSKTIEEISETIYKRYRKYYKI